MDKKRSSIYKIIETAVNKGIRDIKENPNRGIRNLLDLGNYFASRHFQKAFFHTARQILSNENSPYYELASRIVHNVDPNLLKHFGINLGYNSWTYGVEKIREEEKKRGHNIPWTIVFDFMDGIENNLSENDISGVLQNGQSMGIYCGIFFIDNNENRLKALLKMLKSHNNSSYFIFLRPELITNEIARLIVQAGNIAIALTIDASADRKINIICQKAADILLKNKCLYGTYSNYNDDNVEYIMSGNYLVQIENLHSAFAFLIRESLNDIRKKEHFSHFMQASRYTGKYKFFIVDFYEDFASIERTISMDNCFISIKSNGSVNVPGKNELTKKLNIRTHSLQNILKTTMPRINYV